MNKRTIKFLCDFLPKSTIKAGEGLNNGQYPFFTSSSIQKLWLDRSLYNGECLIIGTGGSASCNYYKGKFASSTDNLVITSNKINVKYLYYFLRYDNYKILQNGFHGAGLQHISKSYFENIEVPVVTTEKQFEVVKALDEINKLISLNVKEIKMYDELVKSQFIEMFETLDLSEERKEWTEIKDVSKIYTGTTPSTADETNRDGDILWITPAEMNSESFYINDTVRKITEKGRKSKSLDLMPVNTVLLSTRAPIGKVGIVGVPMTCNQGFKNFECCNRLNPIYLYVLLKNNTEYLNSLGSGTTFLEVSKSTISKLRIPLPEIQEQNKFASFVQQIDKSKFILQKQIDLLNELLEKKMNEYFGN